MRSPRYQMAIQREYVLDTVAKLHETLNKFDEREEWSLTLLDTAVGEMENLTQYLVGYQITRVMRDAYED